MVAFKRVSLAVMKYVSCHIIPAAALNLECKKLANAGQYSGFSTDDADTCALSGRLLRYLNLAAALYKYYISLRNL